MHDIVLMVLALRACMSAGLYIDRMQQHPSESSSDDCCNRKMIVCIVVTICIIVGAASAVAKALKDDRTY